MIGSGFNARFHLHAFVGVRDADIRGIWSPNEKNASEEAGLARSLDVGEPRLHKSISDMVADPAIDAIWVNTLDSGLKLFFSREVKGKSGEDLIEKQNAEIGQMPVVANEAASYGYEAEDRHFVRAFLKNEKAALTFDDGLDVVRLLMAGYLSGIRPYHLLSSRESGYIHPRSRSRKVEGGALVNAV